MFYILYKMSKIKKKVQSSSKILFLYSFKSFKKNLRFKKYSLGITKFIKNRKKYNIRKRKTSNIINYIYLYTWCKVYMITKHSFRYLQFQHLSNYLLVSHNLSLNLTLLKPSTNNLVVNYATVAKNIFFNLTLFSKNRYNIYKSLFSNVNLSVLFFTKLDSSFLLEGVTIFNNYIFKLSDYSSNNQSKYFFIILINTLVKKIVSIITTFRKLLMFGVLSQKILK